MALSQAVIKAISSGRATGSINLNGKGLDHVPSPIYDLDEAMPGQAEAKWWEVRDPAKPHKLTEQSSTQ